MKCPAIFKGSGAHHSMTFSPKVEEFQDLTFVSRQLYYFSLFVEPLMRPTVQVSVFLHVKMFWFF